MSNLLKDASILLTPTGYDNGSMNAIKPENGDGDFTFSRNSAATRVNAQGLVENVQILSGNLVSNGDFSQEGSELVTNGSFATDSDWTKQTSWSISGGSANYDFLSDSKYIRQTLLNGGFVAGKTYKINFEITSGTAYINVSSNASGLINLNTYSVGSYSIYVTPSISASDLLFYGRNTSGTAFSITNISVKEVGQDWTVTGTDANNYVEFGDGTARLKFLNTSPITEFYTSNNILVGGKTYQLTVDIADATSGGVKIDGGGISQEVFDTVGINTRIIKPTSNTNIKFYRATANVDLTFNSVSAIEITDDTNLPRINYEGFSYQDSLGSEEVVNGDFATDSWWGLDTSWTISGGSANSNGTGAIYKGGVLTIGKTYKVEVEVSAYTSGTLNYPNASNYSIPTSIGKHTFYYTATSGTVNFTGTSFVGSIDNVSVKEYLGQEVVPDSGCGSWLLEPQSTNLIPYSEDFSFFTNNNSTTSLNTTTSPLGNTTADTIVSTTSSTFSGIYEGTNSITAGDYTFSVWLKSSNITSLSLRLRADSTQLAVENITITNSWARYSITATAPITSVFQSHVFLNEDGISGVSNVGDEVYIWGAQLEQNSYATSYIPTQGAISTRLADIATNSGNASLINSEQGVLYFEGSALVDEIDRRISLSDGSLNNYVSIGYSRFTSNIVGEIFSNGVSQNLYWGATGITQVNNNKFALSWGNGTLKFYVNGIQTLTTTITPPIGMNVLNFTAGNNAIPMYANIKALAVYKTALTDEQLRSLTYPSAVATTFDLNFNTIAEDFTFTRGSEATFVNAQGLIQSTNELGSEEITNGDFATDTNWDLGNGWTISGGSANSDGINFPYIKQNGALVSGEKYELTFDITSYTSGSIKYEDSVETSIFYSGLGSYSQIFTASSNNCRFQSAAFNGSIDNVSVKEYITATNTPRLDYSTGAEAFLLEPQSTNLIQYSEDFSQGYWTKQSGVTATYNTTETLSPDGNYNATKFVGNGTTGVFKASISVSGVVSRSVYLKSVTGTTTAIFKDPNTNIPSPIALTITNEWQRFEMIGDNGSSFQGLQIDDITSDGLYIWGAQLEQQSYPTSYIPTSGASATRNQELCNNATPVINSEEGTLYAEISGLANDGTNRAISISDGSTANVVRFYYSTTDNRIVGNIKSGGSTVFTYNNVLTDATDFIKIALSYKANNFKMYVNGLEVSIDTIGNAPTSLTELSFDNGAGNDNFYGNTKGLKYYPKALADVQLQDLTTL